MKDVTGTFSSTNNYIPLNQAIDIPSSDVVLVAEYQFLTAQQVNLATLPKTFIER